MPLPTVLAPVFVCVLLTLVLLGATGASRVAALKKREVRMNDVALSNDAWPSRSKQFSNAYHNQLEMPLIFYALTAFVLIAQKADGLFIGMAWLFAVLRLAHAYVHVTSNNVPVRFNLFVAGVATLVAMWVIFAVRIFFG